MRPQDFYVKSRASQGVRVDLVDPGGNKEWMRVRSVISEEFKQASKAVLLRAAQEGKSIHGDPQRLKRQIRLRRAELAASLVADWSLPMKEEKDVAELLISNPRLRRAIERIAEDSSLHFGVQL